MKRTLNLGCGNNTWGTDRVDICETPATTATCNIDNERLPYEDNTFDVIKMSGVLEHLKNLKHLEEEVYRVLKKGGRLLLSTDSATYIFWHTLRRWEHNNYLNYYYQDSVNTFRHSQGKDAHYHLFVKSHLEILFRRFTSIRIRYVGHGGNLLFLLIANILPFNWGKRQIKMEAVK